MSIEDDINWAELLSEQRRPVRYERDDESEDVNEEVGEFPIGLAVGAGALAIAAVVMAFFPITLFLAVPVSVVSLGLAIATLVKTLRADANKLPAILTVAGGVLSVAVAVTLYVSSLLAVASGPAQAGVVESDDGETPVAAVQSSAPVLAHEVFAIDNGLEVTVKGARFMHEQLALEVLFVNRSDAAVTLTPAMWQIADKSGATHVASADQSAAGLLGVTELAPNGSVIGYVAFDADSAQLATYVGSGEQPSPLASWEIDEVEDE